MVKDGKKDKMKSGGKEMEVKIILRGIEGGKSPTYEIRAGDNNSLHFQ